MLRRREIGRVFGFAVSCLLASPAARALNPGNVLTQYTRAVWTQADGLPEDTIRSIAQTSDGYLWLGTDEGVARFDGYQFVTFSAATGSLPSNAIESLAAGRNNVLWIGTSNGLVRYSGGRFRTFTTADGLPDNFILTVFEDHDGVLWVASGIYLSRFDHGRFTNYAPESLLPVRTARAIFEDRDHTLLIAGYGGLVRRARERFEPVITVSAGLGQFVTIAHDRSNNFWIGGRFLARHTPTGADQIFGAADGWPGDMVRSIVEDRDGNIWIGTVEGLYRCENGRLVAHAVDARTTGSWVRSMFEDREGNLWIGMSSGLYRFRDGMFANFGRAEGLPSDEPIAVHQDRRGRIWVGFHGEGLAEVDGAKPRVYTTRDGLASGEVLAISDTRNGDVLAMTRRGVSLLRDGRFSPFVAPDAPAAESVNGILEDSRGRLWAAASGGVYRIENRRLRRAVPEIPGGPFQNDASTSLAEARDGSIWAGTYGEGLWRIDDQGSRRFTRRDGLSSDRIRALYSDPDGALWIGTFEGGLNELRNGVFTHYTARDGLLSDNVAHIDDDGAASLWLATTRGICRIRKQDLLRFSAGELRRLTPVNYTAADGLRSAQCAPGYPIAAGGTRSADGRIWFPTTGGLAVWSPGAGPQSRAESAPAVHLISAKANDVDLTSGKNRVAAGTGHIEFRYAAIHLTAPESVRYQYMLEGLDQDWSGDTDRRIAGYNTLRHGHYRFRVRASVAGSAGAWGEDSIAFDVLPHFYERAGFLWLCAAALAGMIFAAHRFRLKRMRSRFALLLEERTRISREIHDTLAQGFVGISSQLDAVALDMQDGETPAGQRLETARKMARHSITEARRSVMDLRAPELHDADLGSALKAAVRRWQMSGSAPISVTVSGSAPDLPADVQQHLLRIAQEAAANALKHARPSRVDISLRFEPEGLYLRVKDDGRGFTVRESFSPDDGHFGILGMRERAERLGSRLQISSRPGAGTEISVSVPLAGRTHKRNLWQELLGLLRTGASHAR